MNMNITAKFNETQLTSLIERAVQRESGRLVKKVNIFINLGFTGNQFDHEDPSVQVEVDLGEELDC